MDISVKFLQNATLEQDDAFRVVCMIGLYTGDNKIDRLPGMRGDEHKEYLFNRMI